MRWNPGGTLLEPSWNLSSGPPRTTPEPIWAETPKHSAVGEKQENMVSHLKGRIPQTCGNPLDLLKNTKRKPTVRASGREYLSRSQPSVPTLEADSEVQSARTDDLAEGHLWGLPEPPPFFFGGGWPLASVGEYTEM